MPSGSSVTSQAVRLRSVVCGVRFSLSSPPSATEGVPAVRKLPDMQIYQTAIPDLMIIEPKVFGDERGFFLELFHHDKFSAADLPTNFVQDNLSRSKRGTLRGLHYQIEQPQGKLVRALAGDIYDVAVDLRQSSPAFGQWVGVELTAESHRMAYIPPGCAHGFVVLSETADFFYKCTDTYAPEHERTLLWNDESVGIDWPIDDPAALVLSEKDKQGTPFAQAEYYA